MYLCSAALKRFEDDGRPEADLPLLHWGMQDALYRIQVALDGVLQNFPNRFIAFVLRFMVFPLDYSLAPPPDELEHQISKLLMQPGGARDRLTHNMHVPDNENETTGALEAALLSTLACEPVQARVDEALKAGKLREMEELLRISEARDKGVITIDEALMLERDYALRRTVIMVDDFDPRQLAAGCS